jgi:hypothetical protein
VIDFAGLARRIIAPVLKMVFGLPALRHRSAASAPCAAVTGGHRGSSGSRPFGNRK